MEAPWREDYFSEVLIWKPQAHIIYLQQGLGAGPQRLVIGAGYTKNGTTSFVDNRVEHEVTIAPKEQDTIVSIVASPSKKTTPSKPLRLCSKVRTCNRDKTKKKSGDKSKKDKTKKAKDQYEVSSIAVQVKLGLEEPDLKEKLDLEDKDPLTTQWYLLLKENLI